MRDLPRQLSAGELAELFSGRSRLVERLAELEDPLGAGFEAALAALSDEDKAEALAAHPRIGERSPEQHGDEPEVLAELEALNRAYEEQFGFRFVVFVDRRSRREVAAVMRERMAGSRADELDTALSELVAIARDRWYRRRDAK